MELGGTPVLSRFGVLRRVKDGVTKRRVILDAKQSGITAHTRPTYRVELPRATDVVNSVLSTAQMVKPENLELLVCDFAEAFWQVPLAPEEQKYFCGKLGSRILAYQRTSQGSRN
eukprot:5098471-Amphidinium_carterae.1